MANPTPRLPDGRRVTDAIGLGVLTTTYPLSKIKAVVEATGRSSQRERAMPAHVVMYYVLAMVLNMGMSSRAVLRWLLEGIQWLLLPYAGVRVTVKSGITQARQRLGWEPLQRLHEEVVRPIAEKKTPGAWYRQWRVVSLDGSTMPVADTVENEKEFGRPKTKRGAAAYPLLRFTALVENGTHVLFGTQLGSYHQAEAHQAREVIQSLQAGMLCLADRYFTGYRLWEQAQSRGAELLWRGRTHLQLPCEERLADGSYLSWIYPSTKDRQNHTRGIRVRVIEYRLLEVAQSEPFYRLLTTLVDPQQAPARELAALYQQRWEIETALDEFKVHLCGAGIVLRSKTPALVRQEFYGFLLTYFAIRGLMHEAALSANECPQRLSFVHSVQVIRRKLLPFVISPLGGLVASA